MEDYKPFAFSIGINVTWAPCRHYNARWDTINHVWSCKWKTCHAPVKAKNATHVAWVWQRYVQHWDAFRKTELGIPNVD